MISVDVLRSEHVAGSQVFPFFIGFLTAVELNSIAEAPQFALDTAHETIAGHISATPVREWQRPRDDVRVAEITRIFQNSDEIMPNAVLLAAHSSDAVELSSSGRGNHWVLKIDDDSNEKPLWILDGQHRIAGLAGAGRTSPMPFVLLASHGDSSQYSESTFAKIFAQVTTTAQGLHKLHNEWLTYAFGLGKYDGTDPTSGSINAKHRRAMEAVIALCHERHLDTAATITNPFFNRVAFNPESVLQNAPSPAVGPAAGGFQSDVFGMEELFFKSYYGSPTLPSRTLLPPKVLAMQLGLAYEALVACHSPANRTTSVLLNAAGSSGHKPLQEAFLHGVMRFLACHGVPSDWESELDKRAFKTTNWDTSRWTGSRSGDSGNLNKKLARAIFETMMEGTIDDLFIVPTPATIDLRQYFRGAIGWGFSLQTRRRGSRNLLRFDPRHDESRDLVAGNSLETIDLGAHRIIAVDRNRITPNVASVRIHDRARPTDQNWTWQRLLGGMELTSEVLHHVPLELVFDITFYGGERKEIEVNLEA